MSQALENLSGPGKPLKAEPTAAQEITGLLRTGNARVTGPVIATSCFRYCRT